MSVLYDFLDMCVAWARVETAGTDEEKGSVNVKAPEDRKKDAARRR